MTAKSLCEVAHLAAEAGASGNIGDWGVAPDRPSTGQYQRHVQSVANARGIQKVEPMVYAVPGQTRSSKRRVEMAVSTRPFHELLHEEVFADASSLELMKSMMADRSWPTCYHDHAVTRSANDD
eukprot:6858801-Pyramimonas_sp.AAC.1